MRLLSLVLLSSLLALNSGCEERVHAKEASGAAPVGSVAPANGIGSLTISEASSSSYGLAWSATASVTTCTRCGRDETSVYGSNPRTHVYRYGGKHVWSGCHGCLVETLERAK